MKKTSTGVRRTIFYSRFSSPFGAIYVAFTEKGVSRIEFGRGSENNFIKKLENNRLRKVVKNDRDLIFLRKEMMAYFKGLSRSGRATGTPFSFSLPIDFLDGTPFERKVWSRIKKIPYGRVITYGDLASKIGKPKASRAVGMACRKNPLPILIPCHRVIGKDLSLTGYSCGIEIKRRLLEIEGVKGLRDKGR